MQRWEHMAVGQTDCGSYREAQEWVGKKAIESVIGVSNWLGSTSHGPVCLADVGMSLRYSSDHSTEWDEVVYSKNLSSTLLIFSNLTWGPIMTADAANMIPDITFLDDWPRIQSQVAQDPEAEVFIADIVSRMTLEEKVGQMIQPDLREVTPDEVTEYKLGSILNGGGRFRVTINTRPRRNGPRLPRLFTKPVVMLLMVADSGSRSLGQPTRCTVTIMYLVPTVSAQHWPRRRPQNPDLIRQIGAVTAAEVTATGLDWTFAPTVAVPRDYRWGRVYEGYSEDPAVVHAYASAMVEGLQGEGGRRFGPDRVLSTVKHWIGDSGHLDWCRLKESTTPRIT